MREGNSIINLGDLSKPATVLIERVSDAVGGFFKPYQIKRVAQAEAEAKKIKTISDIEVNKLEKRALKRIVFQEFRNQKSIEDILSQAIGELDEKARPEEIEEDWIVNFFDKCKLISDKEMQRLWSKVLAGEANNPNTFSKRTINFISSLDKIDAILFTKLCAFNWTINDDVGPLIYDTSSAIYNKNKIDFIGLKHLASIGLITFENVGYVSSELPQNITATYQDTSFKLKLNKQADNDMDIGLVLLTNIGRELTPICSPERIDEFQEYVVQKWEKSGINVSTK